jgi:hypothetical protein
MGRKGREDWENKEEEKERGYKPNCDTRCALLRGKHRW